MQTVAFTQMKDGTTEEYLFLRTLERRYIRSLPERLEGALQSLGNSLQGYQISRLEHSLQSATRAEADGADIDYIVAALLHDLGDELAPENHSQFAASILRPYVRAEVTWVVEMHGLFQMRYYAHHYGDHPDGYLAYQDHPWFAACCHFCERWDQAAFDPSYPTKPLTYFMPMLREVFSRTAFDPAHLQAS
ncbi:MAG: HD domain-containing protein [Thiothrix sp.]|nr:MAG: HD domain-containing protein [Thiothrix sp.]